MADSAGSELVVRSHAGPYRVRFTQAPVGRAVEKPSPGAHYIVDAKVARLFGRELGVLLRSPSVLRVEATERAKSLTRFEAYVRHLLSRKVRRGDVLVAVGGGIIQDITCFLAATLLRGVDWRFYPTTLLAQADSCIGSKSSINAGGAKNILGTFTPPREIVVCDRFLDSLPLRDIRSGVGEMLKVHAIDGRGSFGRIARDYGRLFTDRAAMRRAIRSSLEIKKGFIEKDEFDRGPRNVLNYGHTFGHALEAATAYRIPHGIAVTMGMDMANFVALRKGLTTAAHFSRMHGVLRRNFEGYERTPVPLAAFDEAIAKDKKNTRTQLGVILPDASAAIARRYVDNDAAFRAACADYLASARKA